MTAIRTGILEVLKESQQPLSAAQVHEATKHGADLASIYRGLRYLEKKGYLQSFVYACDKRGTERYYSIQTAGHKHFLHCSVCHNFVPIEECPLSPSIDGIAEKYNIRIDNHSLTLTGQCTACV